MGFHVCLTCGKRKDAPQITEESHGFCERLIPDEPSRCAMIYRQWATLPKASRPTLHQFYLEHVEKGARLHA